MAAIPIKGTVSDARVDADLALADSQAQCSQRSMVSTQAKVGYYVLFGILSDTCLICNAWVDLADALALTKPGKRVDPKNTRDLEVAGQDGNQE